MRYLLNAVLKLSTNNEGGYVNHPKDPGGPTNHGITIATLRAARKRAVTVDDVKSLTLAEANAIYEANYWKPIWGDQLPAGLDYAMFDFAINSGVSRAVKTLQGLLPGIAIDGVMGPKTIAAVMAFDPADLIKRLCDARLKFVKSLSTFGTFGRGWTYRITGTDPKRVFKKVPGVVGDALAMVEQKPLTLMPFPIDDLLPIGKARDVDIKVLAPLTNKLQTVVAGSITGAGAAAKLPDIVGTLLPQLSQAKDTLDTIKDVSQFFTYTFAAVTVAFVFLTIIHEVKKAREAGLNT